MQRSLTLPLPTAWCRLTGLVSRLTGSSDSLHSISVPVIAIVVYCVKEVNRVSQREAARGRGRAIHGDDARTLSLKTFETSLSLIHRIKSLGLGVVLELASFLRAIVSILLLLCRSHSSILLVGAVHVVLISFVILPVHLFDAGHLYLIGTIKQYNRQSTTKTGSPITYWSVRA